MSACSNHDISSISLEPIQVHLSRASTLENDSPPDYSQVVQSINLASPSMDLFEKKNALGEVCLKIIRTDAYFNGILFVFSIMSHFSSNVDVFVTCIPLVYLLCIHIGKIGFSNVSLDEFTHKEKLSLMIFYTLSFYTRVLLDFGALIHLKLSDSTESLHLSPSKLAFSIPMIGMRPFTQKLFPCEDDTSFQMLGYCPDRFMVNGNIFSPFSIYIFSSIFELLVGAFILLKTRSIYLEECVPLGLQS